MTGVYVGWGGIVSAYCFLSVHDYNLLFPFVKIWLFVNPCNSVVSTIASLAIYNESTSACFAVWCASQTLPAEMRELGSTMRSASTTTSEWILLLLLDFGCVLLVAFGCCGRLA